MKRRLTSAEQALWEHVTSGVAPRRRRSVASPAPPVSAKQGPAKLVPAERRKVPGVKQEPKATLKPAADLLQPPRLDGRRSAQFLKGELQIEGRIDLHGFTLDMAHKALAGFLMQARGRGHRMVLVITGKGGTLKRLVPLWLSAPPFAQIIAGLAIAQPKHGGEGALYLYLRRKRA